MHQESKVRARTEVLVLFIVDNLCPACSTGGPAGRKKEGATKMLQIQATVTPEGQPQAPFRAPQQPKQRGEQGAVA